MRAGARITAAGAAALTVGLAGCGSPSGFHNMTTLEQSMTTKYNHAANNGENAPVSSVTCVSTGTNTASCLAQFSSGYVASQNFTVAISADGNTWVSTPTG